MARDPSMPHPTSCSTSASCDTRRGCFGTLSNQVLKTSMNGTCISLDNLLHCWTGGKSVSWPKRMLFSASGRFMIAVLSHFTQISIHNCDTSSCVQCDNNKLLMQTIPLGSTAAAVYISWRQYACDAAIIHYITHAVDIKDTYIKDINTRIHQQK